MISYNLVIVFLLVFIRFSGLFLNTPFFGSRRIPRRIKIALSFSLALLVFPLLPDHIVTITTPVALGVAIAKELLVGYLLGLMVSMVFSMIQIAGRFIDFQLGFAMVNVVDPNFGSMVPVTGQLGYIFTVLVFLAINGHHYLLKAMADSFNSIPLFNFTISPYGMRALTNLFLDTFVLSVRIAMPVMGALFLSSVALGILARAVPQMNVFVVGMPAKIFIGIAVLCFMLPVYLVMLERIFGDYMPEIVGILNHLLRG